MNLQCRYDAVLVPLDGSRLGAQALPPAASFAREAGCKLVLLHVLPDEAVETATVAPGYDLARERWVRRSQMQAYLEGLKHSLGDFGIEIETCLVEGDAAEMILKTACNSGRVMLVLTDTGMGAAKGGVVPYEEGRVYAQVTGGWRGPLLVVNS